MGFLKPKHSRLLGGVVIMTDLIPTNKHPDFDSIFKHKVETPFGTLSIKPFPDFDANTIPFDSEIESVRQQYCANSGRPLAIVPHQIVADLITIHGRETTLKILLMQQKKYSYEWLWLNNEGLESLAVNRVHEYFVYTCSKLLQDCTLHSELMRMNEAAIAWRNLQKVDEDIITPINELIRRLLANYKQKDLNPKLAKLINKHVNVITESIDNLVMFQLELTDMIQAFVAQEKKDAAILKGLSVFKMQRMITNLSQLEIVVGRELNDFDFIDGKASEIVHGKTGTAYRHLHIKRGHQYSKKPIVKKGSGFKFKLNLGRK